MNALVTAQPSLSGGVPRRALPVDLTERREQAPTPASILAPLAYVPSAPRSATPRDFGDTLRSTVRDWAHEGKKLGTLAATSAIGAALPLQLLMLIPSATLITVAAPVALVGSLVAAALEERYIGVGRHLGALAGGALGVVAGTARAAFESVRPPAPRAEKVTLESAAPTGARPHEPLLPRVVHAAERRITGRAPDLSGSAVGIGEAVGATLSTLVTAYTLPAMVGAAVGGPVGAAMGTLVGPLTGMIAGGVLENALGVGRMAGEAVGRAVQHFKGSAPSAPTTPSAPAKPHGEPGVITKAFLELNHIIAEPITPFLVDGATLTNRLFAERPVQTMAFRDRPSPGVDRNRLVESFVNLRGISGTSDHEGEVSAEIGRQLDALGIAYARKPDHTIIATIPGTVKDAPTVVLSAHLDTVGPTSPDGVRRDSRVIHTNEREVLGGDDRAGCAEILEAVRRIIETGADHPEIKLVFDVCEEGGLKGATRLVADEISQRPALGYVVDALAPEDINLTNDAVFVNPRSVKYTFSQEAPVVQVAMRGMADAGSRARPMHVPIMAGAGSDANAPAFNNARIQTIAIGAGERDIHGPLENVRIDDLEQAARNVVGIIQAACDLRVDGDTIVPRAQR